MSESRKKHLVSFDTMMALEQVAEDTFSGIGPTYPWKSLYGGQAVSQALRAASLTVEPRFLVHSLHAYFIRRGDDTKPIHFDVERTRDGRSFCSRSVVARQSNGTILTLIASFQISEEGVEVQRGQLDPALGPPPQQEVKGWTPLCYRAAAKGMVNGSDGTRSAAWLKMSDALENDPAIHACALAYLSDDLAVDSVMTLHPRTADIASDADYDRLFSSASIDHAIYFHHPAKMNGWNIFEYRGRGLHNNRGLSTGEVYSADGIHVATVVQEVLLREKRQAPSP